MMDVRCEECGRRYRVDETQMRAATAKVKCKSCGNVITVSRPPAPPAAPAAATDILAATERLEPAAGSRPAIDLDPALAAPPPHRVRFGLFPRTLLVMLLVSLIPFGVFGFITLRETDARIREDAEALMAQTAKGLVEQVDDWIKANVGTLRTAAGLEAVASMKREEQEPVLKAFQKEHPWMYLVFTLGLDGGNIARSDDQALRDYSDRQYYKDVAAGKALAWQTVVGRTSNVPALILAVPIKKDGVVIGVMAAAMTVEELSRRVATWKRGASGFAFLLDEKGFVIAHPQKKFIEARENLNTHPLIAAFRKKGWTSISTSFPGEAGQPALGHARSGSTGWVLALQQDESEVFENLIVMRNFAVWLLAVTVALVAAIAWFSSRKLVKPIRKLTDAAERLSLGELDLKIDVASRDEIGLLAQAIGRMQTSLQIAMRRLQRKT